MSQPLVWKYTCLRYGIDNLGAGNYYNIRGTSAQQLFIIPLNSVSDYMFRPSKWSSSGPPS